MLKQRPLIGAVDKIMLTKNKQTLIFRKSPMTGGFFKTLKDFTQMQTAGLFGDEDHGEERQAYSAKSSALQKRFAKNRVLEISPEETRRLRC